MRMKDDDGPLIGIAAPCGQTIHLFSGLEARGYVAGIKVLRPCHVADHYQTNLLIYPLFV
jgi:hypothetical protein